MTPVETLAEHWKNGPAEAVTRLTHMIEAGERFDARDRQALAYLLEAYKREKWRADELADLLRCQGLDDIGAAQGG